MTPAILFSIDCARWPAALPDAEAILGRAIRAAIRHLARGRGYAPALEASVEISVLLTDDATMRDLNARYRGKDTPTNVLSFAALNPSEATRILSEDARGSAPPVLLGDIALGLETTEREAAAQGKTLANHVSHLAVHGVLHLFGHDHEHEDEAARMEALERVILAGLDIPDPYDKAKA